MKALVVGAGKIGSAVARDLAGRQEVQEVGIIGRSSESLAKAQQQIKSEKITPYILNVAERDNLYRLMQSYQVGVVTLPDRRSSYRAIETAIEAGMNVVDVLEEYHRRPDKHETEGLELPAVMSLDEYGERLHQRALDNGVTVLDGMGFEPGLSNVTVGAGIRQMDNAKSVVVRVGGIPSKETAQRHPLKYVITWAFEHVLREYMVKVNVIRDGRVIEVDASTQRESFTFTKLGRNEDLEAAITPGMPSFVHTRPELENFVAKTIRWPGHWQGVETLKECGLLELTPVPFNGGSIIPRKFVSSILEPRLRPRAGDTDCCVMWNTVRGIKNGQEISIDYFMWDEADVENQISSMARVTAYTAAAAAVLLAQRQIKQTGIVAPEDGVYGEAYRMLKTELMKRNILIEEEQTPMT